MNTEYSKKVLVNFDNLQAGDTFMFSLRTRNEFKKLGDSKYTSLAQSDRVVTMDRGQAVLVDNRNK